MTLEIPATLFGLINVYLVTRNRMLNWLFGICTVSLYILIFYHAKLYADMCLQFVFLGFQFFGWYQWLYGGKNFAALTVRRANKKIWMKVLTVFPILFLTIVFILIRYTDSSTVYMDAFVTALSLLAQWMLSKKWVENFLLWMLVDIVAINMYVSKSLYMTSLLYIVFFSLCVYGYISWKKQLPYTPIF